MKQSHFLKSIFTALFCLVLSSGIAAQSTDKKYEATWESLTSRPYPQWFSDCKLGIFIHWGLYSVPSYSDKEQYAEWYMRGIELKDTIRQNFQDRVFGEDFEYKDFVPHFKAELFDASEWAKLFKESGAGYVLLVTKHHDGYCLWPSKHRPGWNSVETGPKRNIVGELTSAVRTEGMKMGLYYSLPEWNHPLHDWYDDDPRSIKPYVEQYMIPQFKDLIGTYKPSLIFTDGEWWNTADEWHAKELMAWYFNLVGKDAIVNNRWGSGNQVGFLTPEYSSGEIKTDKPWTELRGLGRSFGLNRNETIDAYMTPEELIHFFVKTVAHGGGVTINVGPKADGQIPLLQQERLLQLGQWLKVNGDAIYKSNKWKKTHEEKTVELSRVDENINFNWVRNSPGSPIKEDQFKATWTGFIKADNTEEYQIEALADDGIRIWINDELVVDKWKVEEGGTDSNVMSNKDAKGLSGKIKMRKNKLYPIKVEYFEDKLNASVSLSWATENQEKQIIPTDNLFTTSQMNENGLNAVYESQKTYMCYTQRDKDLYATVFEWPGKELLIPNVDFEIQNIQLVGTDIQLPWKKTAEGVLIDLSNVYANYLPCNYAWVFKLTKQY